MKNIHVIPTDKRSRLLINWEKDLCYKSKPYLMKGTQNIYITSDEKIKKGNWVYSEARKTLFKVKSIYNTSAGYLLIEDDVIMPLEINEVDCKKIILTTDSQLIADGVQAIPDEFLQWFVKNPSCQKVKIDILDFSQIVEEPKQDYSVFIKQKEEEFRNFLKKKETLEEAGVAYSKTVNQNHTSHMLGFLNGAKWKQERLCDSEVIQRIRASKSDAEAKKIIRTI